MTDQMIIDALASSGLTAEYIEQMSCSLISRDEIAEVSGLEPGMICDDGGFRIPYQDVACHDGSQYYRIRQFCGNPKYVGIAGHSHEPYLPVNYQQNSENNRVLWISEGEKKAALADNLGIPSIGIPGVHSWADTNAREAEKLLGMPMSGNSTPHKTLVREALKYDAITIIGDNDLLTNHVARGGMLALRDALQQAVDRETMKLLTDPNSDLINTPRNITVELVILPPMWAEAQDEKGNKTWPLEKLGLDDLFVQLQRRYDGLDLTPEQIRLRAKHLLCSIIASLGIAETEDEVSMAKRVAASCVSRLAHREGQWFVYEPHTGNWNRTNASEELGSTEELSRSFAHAAEVLAGVKVHAMEPFKELKPKELPAVPAMWSKQIDSKIKRLKAQAVAVCSTKAAFPITRQMSRMLKVPETRWEQRRDLLTVGNGVLNLQSGELLPFSPSHFSTKSTPVIYDPLAECPEWESFLERVHPDPETRRYYQAIMGCCLTGESTQQQLYFMKGLGGNGKGTANTALREVFGAYAKVGAKSLVIKPKNGGEAHPTALNAIAGARWVTISELDDTHNLDCGALKTLTGGDRMTARGIGQDFHDFDPTWTVTSDTNDVPFISDTSPSMRRRLVVIDWNYSAIADPDRDLPTRLRAESSGILNWLLEGARMYYAGALKPENIPDAVRKSTAQLWAQMDTTTLWRDSECVSDPGVTTLTYVLLASYREWAEANGFGGKHITIHFLNKRLRLASFEVRSSNGKQLCHGLRLRNAAEAHMDLPDTMDEEISRKPAGSETESPAKKTRRLIQ